MENLKQDLKSSLKKYEKLTNTKREEQALQEIGQVIKKSCSTENILQTENFLNIILDEAKKMTLKKKISLLTQFSFSIVI